MITEMLKKLKNLGFTKNEAKIYLALLKLGSVRAGTISKETQLNRTTTYDVLKNLLDKGLTSYVIQANRKWFRATNPQRILEMIKEKEEDAKEILPQLHHIYKKPKHKHNITLYYGYKGMKTVFEDFIREGKPISVIDPEPHLLDKMPYYAQHYIRQVNKNKIKLRHIVSKGFDVKPTKTTEVRFIPKVIKSDAALDVYGDKIAILIWTDPPEAVIIKNKTAADSFREYFDIIWKVAKP
jgi:sugar-specific transcriptional regulator TrmB